MPKLLSTMVGKRWSSFLQPECLWQGVYGTREAHKSFRSRWNVMNTRQRIGFVFWHVPTVDRQKIIHFFTCTYRIQRATLVEEEKENHTVNRTGYCRSLWSKSHFCWRLNCVIYCMAGKFCQRKISSKATAGQFVRTLFSSNVSRRSFAYRLSSHHEYFWSHICGFVKNLVRNLI